ncbi:MAG: hypothetical protein ACOWWR_00885 [Eubacteriales bacterium]
MSNRLLMNIECESDYSNQLEDVLAAHTGETVTIYTTSGGDSGAGFTGVILSVESGYIRLISEIGGPPGCALNTACNQNNYQGCYPRKKRKNFNGVNNSRGSVVVIPLDRIASFVHNAL